MVRRLKEELNLDWDSKFSDLNLDLILNLVLLPKNFKMENHENHRTKLLLYLSYLSSLSPLFRYRPGLVGIWYQDQVRLVQRGGGVT